MLIESYKSYRKRKLKTSSFSRLCEYLILLAGADGLFGLIVARIFVIMVVYTYEVLQN